jgi:hypothetical protein
MAGGLEQVETEPAKERQELRHSGRSLDLSVGKPIEPLASENRFGRWSSIREGASQTCPAWDEVDRRKETVSRRSAYRRSKRLDQDLAARGHVALRGEESS